MVWNEKAWVAARKANTRPLADRFFEKTMPVTESGCLLWTGALNGRGYGQIMVNHKPRKAHHIAWILEHGDIPNGKYVLHKCDVRSCVRPEHLFLGTQKENLEDMRNKNRGNPPPRNDNRGENHGMSKLTANDVIGIRAELASGKTQSEIANAFHISRTVISQINSGKRWKHI